MISRQQALRQAKLADLADLNLTDGGQHSLFHAYLHDVYHRFFYELDLQVLQPVDGTLAQIALTGYPQGLPSWKIHGGIVVKRIPDVAGYEKRNQHFLNDDSKLGAAWLNSIWGRGLRSAAGMLDPRERRWITKVHAISWRAWQNQKTFHH